MRYRLRTLVIATAVVPPILAVAWFVVRDPEARLLIGAVFVMSTLTALLGILAGFIERGSDAAHQEHLEQIEQQNPKAV